MNTAPKGVWLVAGTPISVPYPCRCETWRKGCSAKFCPCSGRVDLAVLPPWCCARVNTPAADAAAQRS